MTTTAPAVTVLQHDSMDQALVAKEQAPISREELDVTSVSALPPITHFKITLRRSAIALGRRKQETLHTLGIHHRHQTVFHRHSPEVAGKILFVKELVEVENVPASMVRTKTEMMLERRAPRGFLVVGNRLKENLIKE
jgi:ribosomal protein L30